MERASFAELQEVLADGCLCRAHTEDIHHVPHVPAVLGHEVAQLPDIAICSCTCFMAPASWSGCIICSLYIMFAKHRVYDKYPTPHIQICVVDVVTSMIQGQ